MNRDDAFSALSSGVPAERLKAARYLQFWAVVGDIPLLRAATHGEPVIWVRTALEAALRRLGDVGGRAVDLDDFLQEDIEANADLASLARSRVARSVVHELEPIVGAIGYYAELEIDDYDESKTHKHVDRLARMLRAIEKLGKVASNPKLTSVDLPLLLSHIIEGERVAFSEPIGLEGPVALQVTTDPDFLEVIVGNAVRNACEAVAHVSSGLGEVTVLYGINDRELWISVVDNGGGMPLGSSEQLFELGTSTKEDHLGVGLALASEAARALGGGIRLHSDDRNTRFELSITLVGEV